MDTNMYEVVELAIDSLAPQSLKDNFVSYLLGASATIVGVIINRMVTSDDTIVEFNKTLEEQSYLQEMRALFMKKDHFENMIKTSVLLLVGYLIMSSTFVFYLAFKLFQINSRLKAYQVNADLKLKNTEDVIESILKESEIVDIEQLKFFKSEIEQQRTAFQNLILNKSLELETKISDAKSVCIKTKKAVHEDLAEVEKLVANISGLRKELDNINELMEITRNNSKLLEIDMKHFSDDINKKMADTIAKFSSRIHEVNQKVESQEVNLFKCNALLLNSQTLLEASICKFEALEYIKNSQESDNISISSRILSCIKKANEFQQYMDQIDSKSVTTKPNNSTDLSLELPSTTGYTEKTFNLTSTNSAIYKILQKIDVLEKEVSLHDHLISRNTDGIKIIQSNTSDEISNIKSFSDDWVISWVSVIYGLFNSSFLQLENQLFDIDCLEYSTVFEVENDDNGKLFEEIMSQCKQTCLKAIKEVNLLIFEYYLIQNSYACSKSSLIGMCNVKIDDEIEQLFEYVEQLINSSDINAAKQQNIKNTLFKLKHDLKSDLKSDTHKFNDLVKQNLDDFYIIHDTMKSLIVSQKEKSSDHDNEYDNSIIELSDHTDSLLSSQENSSFSENDSSLIESSIPGTKLKPLKLADSSATQRKRLSL